VDVSGIVPDADDAVATITSSASVARGDRTEDRDDMFSSASALHRTESMDGGDSDGDSQAVWQPPPKTMARIVHRGACGELRRTRKDLNLPDSGLFL
jgi:hypothetical protein